MQFTRLYISSYIEGRAKLNFYINRMKHPQSLLSSSNIEIINLSIYEPMHRPLRS